MVAQPTKLPAPARERFPRPMSQRAALVWALMTIGAVRHGRLSLPRAREALATLTRRGCLDLAASVRQAIRDRAVLMRSRGFASLEGL